MIPTPNALSRRIFLRQLLLGGLIWSVGRSAQASGQRIDPHQYALLADTHIAADRARTHQGGAMAANLETVVHQILTRPTLPAAAFIAGDLAFSRGETGDYHQLNSLLRPLRSAGVPVYLALGNHDHRERFLESLPWAFRPDRPWRERCCTVVPTPRANWFILDSLEQTLSTPGLLGPDQLRWLAGALDARRRKAAILVFHHHPDWTANRLGLKDTEALFEVIRPRPQVKACIFGHTHRWELSTDASGIHLVNLPPTSYVFRPEYPVGWVEARLRPDGMDLCLLCLDERHSQHRRHVNLNWRSNRSATERQPAGHTFSRAAL